MIDKSTSIKELALIVSTKLREAKIDAVLVGGAVVSIYTHNEYESGDLDFISSASDKKLIGIMSSLGFLKKGKSFVSASTDLYIEFPSGPVSVGDELLTQFNEIKEGRLVLKLFTPTQCIMDRLSAFYFWSDSQSLDQAVSIAKKQPFSLSKIKKWSEKEGQLRKFEVFEKRIK